MVHQLLEHVGCDAGISVPLGVAVPVGVEEDARLVERDLLICAPPVSFHDDVDVEVGQSVEPGAVPLGEQVLADRLDAVGIAHLRGQQRQVLRGCVREAPSHALLLLGDQRGGRRGDGQAPAKAVGLVVVVDEDGLAVLISIEAVPAQIADLLRSAPRVDDQFHCDPDVRGRDGIECVQLGAELPHDLLGEVLASLGLLCLIGDVLLSEDHITGQPVQRLAGAGETQGTHATQDPSEPGDPLVAPVRGQGALLLQERLSVKEGDEVRPAQAAEVHAVIVALQPQALRELRQALDAALDRDVCALTAMLWQFLNRPCLRRFTQPGLATDFGVSGSGFVSGPVTRSVRAGTPEACGIRTGAG